MITNLQKKTENPSYKRRLASLEGCQNDLKNELLLMFSAFYSALNNYKEEVVQTPPEARARGFEASLLNSKMIQSIQEHFPRNWKFGKYKRFTLRINGYIILFKKFNQKGLPMNIKTKSVTAISQQLSIPLFDDTTFVAEPILFFGYSKDSIGRIINPKLVYIDEDQVKWEINRDSASTVKTISISKEEKIAMPKLRSEVVRKNVSNK
ncbi:hypothetical protein [Lacinutrix sp. Bg11-31]|uniref:hypothetical protein n=1 Tax=Lacinutrix sp. Bg11-31 TaxID=2057808 RepID=UPI000C3003BA|nr:hypothetical protein [Lacinutrix sp. Bg11-31]AUC82554.1 hypothetical protein CW733_10630 [Lacinutrix sp. Bg11-31]